MGLPEGARFAGAVALLLLLPALPGAASAQNQNYSSPLSRIRPPTPDSAAAAAFAPNIRPTIRASRAAGGIVVDGELDDAGWVGVARATNWAERFPKDNVLPPVPSEAWVSYDSTHLYFAFVANNRAHDTGQTLVMAPHQQFE